MLAIKKYFTSRRGRSSDEFETPRGLVCTCPHGTGSSVNVGGAGVSEKPRRRTREKDDLSLPSPSLLRRHQTSSSPSVRQYPTSSSPSVRQHSATSSVRQAIDDEGPSCSSASRYHRYRRSVSLDQILQSSDGSHSDGGLTTTTHYPYSSASLDPPDHHPPGGDADGGRELSDFEKENLLFLRDLDNSYYRPLTHSLSNTSLGSTFSEDSLAGESTPRGGSPYPGRREYPRTAYSPSKTSPSKIIRSISREEDEDDLSEDEIGRGKDRDSFKRKISLPVFMGRGSTSDSSAPSSVCSLPGSSAWWSHKPVRLPPPRKYSTNHSPPYTSSINQAKMLFTNRSFSSPAGQSTSSTTPANKKVNEISFITWDDSPPPVSRPGKDQWEEEVEEEVKEKKEEVKKEDEESIRTRKKKKKEEEV
ncbi:hypothetical protein Hamer_G017481 [Homarus americanus]|uniref:Uncharacterized protein n=1 Tax=Homarus americanus TaxID=6706 RepID=A0A8J5JVJ7_HOMAM|nr:hypothetical protein Hamer_G017481 [Homarus americanus]